MWRLWPLIIAGEAIFVLPFMVPRLFKPLMLEQWGLNNAEIGGAMSLYGIVAVIAYFLGGPLADRFSSRILMTTALLATAAIGCCYIFIEHVGVWTLAMIYAGFGLTTILLFWSAMIRATDVISRQNQPDRGSPPVSGLAFGLLDGGRGLVAAMLGSGMAWTVTDQTRLSTVMTIAVLVVLVAAAVVWFGLRNLDQSPGTDRQRFQKTHLTTILTNHHVWIQGVVLLCAYVGYKSIDNFGIFVVDRYQYSPSDAAALTSAAFWLRPVAAVIAGYAADRMPPFIVMLLLFTTMFAGTAGLWMGSTLTIASSTILISIASAAASVYAMRAIYFAVMDQLAVPAIAVGTAAGLISTIGFLPDIFFGAITGYWIDQYPDGLGYQITFASVAMAAIVGMTLSLWQHRTSVPRPLSDPGLS